MPRRLRPIPYCLFSLLISASVAWAQQTGGLRISVLAGEGATNYIDNGQAAIPLVQVLDAQGEPVTGAEVRFSAPATGPSVTFFGAAPATTLLTDPEGRAQPSGMLPNTYEGSFAIKVTASHQGQTATVLINQTNAVAEVPQKKKKRLLGWRAIGGITAAVVIGIIAAVNTSGEQ